ncbi:hypothetical protein CYV15_07980 [Riemerella anatipestifer]|uniref:Uncharacterized protein n=1 Tax=Riemerella anatipestifer (strain ATCC 11845 / DSM 15868 / JCM 9532 / NCTC 11014) TaxID=693978 RepID=E4TBQ9_RIEAD|nr:hypothetical protein Riean_0792 [Riemerella anatipestifer ATCC 11845 = DSM 15868]AKQ39544.1 hypothetical protein AS87_04225 [Riemerella anatipestifer Yb2]EFT36046.1 hypothetical protein RAYM_01942 [Riemerella anatipestifer RA-YM]MDD1525301.1 hypothetical protein [Riemerella anatipestifer]AFD55960.1 hypothetical protein RA0C_1030 [Riemerella anatipestifer ATCC 11845 = DSM 15868]
MLYFILIVFSIFYIIYNSYYIVMDFGSIGIFNLVSNLIVSVYIIGSVFYILKNKTNNKQ